MGIVAAVPPSTLRVNLELPFPWTLALGCGVCLESFFPPRLPIPYFHSHFLSLHSTGSCSLPLADGHLPIPWHPSCPTGSSWSRPQPQRQSVGPFVSRSARSCLGPSPHVFAKSGRCCRCDKHSWSLGSQSWQVVVRRSYSWHGKVTDTSERPSPIPSSHKPFILTTPVDSGIGTGTGDPKSSRENRSSA